MKELVNHPEHYNHGSIECIDAMIAAKGIKAVKNFCDCSVFKYNWRLGYKDAEAQEINKMIWYLEKYKTLKVENTIDKNAVEKEIKDVLQHSQATFDAKCKEIVNIVLKYADCK